MKKSLTIILILNINLTILAQINGTLDVIHGKKVLKVWGTHSERGYAHGYLLGEEIKHVFDEYVIDHL